MILRTLVLPKNERLTCTCNDFSQTFRELYLIVRHSAESLLLTRTFYLSVDSEDLCADQFETLTSPKGPSWAYELLKTGLVKFSFSPPKRLPLGIPLKRVSFPFPLSPAPFPSPNRPFAEERKILLIHQPNVVL